MTRELRIEKLDERTTMAGDFGYLDVNFDGNVTAADAITVINHIAPEPVAYTMTDVDDSGFVTARDALLIINHMDDPPAKHTITVSFGGTHTHGLTPDEVDWAISRAFQKFEDATSHNLHFQIVAGSAGRVHIASQELYIGGGYHARGQVLDGIGGRQVRFHNGTVTDNPSVSPWQAFVNPPSLEGVVMHEIGHTFSWRHTSDPTCVMHINAPREWCGVESFYLRQTYK